MSSRQGWFDVVEIAPGIHQLTEGRPALPCNAFVVGNVGTKEALVVDSALGIGDLYGAVKSLLGSGASMRLLLTHSHWDHIGGAHQFERVAIDERERGDNGDVAIDTLSEEFLDRPAQFVADWRALGETFPTGFDPDGYTLAPATNVEAVTGGDQLIVGKHTLELLSVPGHSPGQLAAIDEEAGVCFGADVVGIDRNVYAHFQHCDLEAYRQAVATLIDNRDAQRFNTLCSGHNEPFVGDELSILDAIHDGLERVIAGSASGTVVDTDWGPANRYSFEEFVVLTSAI